MKSGVVERNIWTFICGIFIARASFAAGCINLSELTPGAFACYLAVNFPRYSSLVQGAETLHFFKQIFQSRVPKFSRQTPRNFCFLQHIVTHIPQIGNDGDDVDVPWPRTLTEDLSIP